LVGEKLHQGTQEISKVDQNIIMVRWEIKQNAKALEILNTKASASIGPQTPS